MKKAKELITFFKKLSRPIKILFCSGLFFLVLGSILVLLSFQNEVLDNRYIITDIKEHISKPLTDLSPGEIRATVSTEYQKQGIYKLVFTNYTNAKDTKNIIQKDSYFSIIDIIGNGYQLNTKKIIINDKLYKLKTDTLTSDEGIVLQYAENVLYIDIPENLILKPQHIEVYISLKSRDSYVEYKTTQDTYFNLTPSSDNDFYQKKDSQSYMMDGYGYIKLKKK